MLIENCKVGMTVRCIKKGQYGVTNDEVACKILKVNEENLMVKVEYDIVNHTCKDLDDGQYIVDPEYFEPYTIKRFFIEVEW